MSDQTEDPQRHLKDLQHIDQSLRTVATQLLNVTNSDSGQTEKNVSSTSEKVVSEKQESVNVNFGRPTNSKFSHLETSHPGQAMALTEEELEKEMSSTRLMTAYKNHPTTTGGISTWILLNPPTTTMKSETNDEKQEPETRQEIKLTVKPTTEKIELRTEQDRPLTSTRKPASTTTKKSTTTKPERTTQKLETTLKVKSTSAPSSEKAVSNSSTASLNSTANATTKKSQQVSRTTAKPKVTTPRTSTTTKPAATSTRKPGQGRPKPTPARRTTPKAEVQKTENVSTGKIEKVTFRPVQIITTSKSKIESTEKPMFITKIKASVLMESQKSTTPLPAATSGSSELKSNSSEVSVKPKPVGTKVNNVLKVQLKRPLDETTKIEIEPIKVNAPVLKIEKIEKNKQKEDASKQQELKDTRVSVKVDFNPELTRVNVESEPTTSTAASTTSTKRPRQNSKRKKNKTRRRKPSTTSTTTLSTTMSTSVESEVPTEPMDNAIQESKIIPEMKIANATKTKKKPPQKPISTQIYNFLSREVMPSFGVMSLVGLGLGLASYFLYPFGGTINRRNYEVEPNYKYNFDEYGGNYGQSEEEVLSKVLQGMTNHENKYQKDFDSYYRYRHYDTNDRKTSNGPVYRPIENSAGLKYRNTEYSMYDPATTPNYYSNQQKRQEFVVGQDIPGNRQFVVGNIPKEYPLFEDKLSGVNKKNVYESTESGQSQFERDIAQGLSFPPTSVNQNYRPESQTIRNDDGYEEIEITPTAVAVEHGPRAMKVKRSVPDDHSDSGTLFNDRSENTRASRSKRDSVIQVIPSKRELEEAEKEEDLSNEILDIIDLALPGSHQAGKDKGDIDRFNKKKKYEESLKESSSTAQSASTTVSSTTEEDKASPTEQSEESTSEKHLESSSTPSSTSTDSEKTDTKETEGPSDWFETTTKQPETNFNLFNFVKKVAEIKFRLGLTILKHASEGFARYLGHVQKRLNGEE